MTTTCERCWEHAVPIVDGMAAELCVDCELVEARAEIERLRARVPNPDDLREVLDVVRWVSDPDSRPGQAQARVRATMEEA